VHASLGSITAAPARRAAHGALAGIAAVALALLVVRTGVTWWQAALMWVVPDIPLLAGMGRGMERGRLHPRAVPAYNALHRMAGPALAGALAAASGWAPPVAAAALAWLLHVSLDRAAGYGLRTPEGYQRGA